MTEPETCPHIEELRAWLKSHQIVLECTWDYNSAGIKCLQCNAYTSLDEVDRGMEGSSTWP